MAAILRAFVQFLALFNPPIEGIESIGTTVADIGFSSQTLDHNGEPRSFLEYTPESVKENPALVITFHGMNSNNWVNYEPGSPVFKNLVDSSDKKGFIIVAPQAQKAAIFGISLFFSAWHDYGRWWLQPPVDDVGFTEALIDWAADERGVNRSLVFVAGVSGGGTLVYRLLNERSSLFAAASVLTASYQEESKVPAPEGYVPTPLITFIGTKDPFFPYNGGSSILFDVRSMDDTLSFFAGLNGISNDRLQTTVLQAGACQVDQTKYESATAPVESYTIMGSGHLTPGTDLFPLYAPLIRLIFGPLTCNKEFDFFPPMLEFFERFGL